MKYLITVTEMVPTEKSMEDIVAHTMVVDDLFAAAKIIENLEILFTVLLTATIVPLRPR